MIDEKVLSVALQDLADQDETPPPPLAALLRRGHRARAGLIARTAAVTAAAVVAGVAVTVQPPRTTPVPLALAAQTTERTTFQFRVDVSVVGDDGAEALRTVPWLGKYDPVHDRGYRRWEASRHEPGAWEERQIGPDCFIMSRPDGRWYRSTRCWRPIDSAETAALGESASPGDLLAQLRRPGQVRYLARTGKGAHTVDTYRFSYRVSRRIAREDHVVKTGTVDIDVTNRRIIKVSYLIESRPPASHGSAGRRGAARTLAPVKVVMRFDDFGTPVEVVEPTDIVDPDEPLEPARPGSAQPGSAQPGSARPGSARPGPPGRRQFAQGSRTRCCSGLPAVGPWNGS